MGTSMTVKAEERALPTTFGELQERCRHVTTMWCGRKKCMANYLYCEESICPAFDKSDPVPMDKLVLT